MPAGKFLSDLNPSGTAMGQTTADLISMYGGTPVSQRASSIQAASLVSAQSFISVTSNLAAFCAEVAASLTGTGVWKGGA